MKKIWIALFLAAAGMLAAFLLLSFHLTKSQAANDSTLVSSRGGIPASQTIGPFGATQLFVDSQDRLGRSLQTELAAVLKSQPNFGVIQVLSASTDQADTPLMTIEVKNQKVFWTPVYATSELEIKVSYASNGNVSFRHSDPPQFKFTDGNSGIMMSGTYTFADVSAGIVSLPGYHDYVAGQIARTIAEGVQKQLQN